MAGIAKLGVADLMHRTLVTGLAGLSVYGLYGMYRIHNDTMKAGEAAWQKHLADEAAGQSNAPLTDKFGEERPPAGRLA